jgi:hypothetical protein
MACRVLAHLDELFGKHCINVCVPLEPAARVVRLPPEVAPQFEPGMVPVVKIN